MTPDATSDALRDDLAETRWALRLYKLMLRAALDQLALAETDPERFAAMRREDRKEREAFVARELCKDAAERMQS